MLPRAVAALVFAVSVAACGGGDDGTAGGTVPLFAGAGPAGERSDRPAPGGDRGVHDVAMVGDSITVASTDAIEQAVPASAST